MVAQIAIALKNTIELFTRLTYAEDSTGGMPVYVGSIIGVSVGQVFPAPIDLLTFSSEFLTLLPKGLAATLRVANKASAATRSGSRTNHGRHGTWHSSANTSQPGTSELWQRRK
jgi:hypothetical protein